jgi:hypothetical protein
MVMSMPIIIGPANLLFQVLDGGFEFGNVCLDQD